MREILFRGFNECNNEKEKVFYNGVWHNGEWVEGYYYVTRIIDDCIKLNIIIHNLLSNGINRYKIFELTNALANEKTVEEALKLAEIVPEKDEGADTNELHK